MFCTPLNQSRTRPFNRDSSFSFPPSMSNIPRVSRESGVSLNGVDTLFLGAGNFSLPLSFIHNHTQGSDTRHFASRVLITEYKSREECLSDSLTLHNYNTLLSLGAQVAFGIDATQIDKTFAGHHFSRIQFDCPDTGKEIFCSAERRLPRLIDQTAKAASRLQTAGDTLHFTLITPEDTWATWLGVHYEIPQVENAGYYLNEGRCHLTGQMRYNKYIHKKTFGDDEVDAAVNEQMSEFVFVNHPTQRTPHRYKSYCTGFKKARNLNYEEERVDVGQYSYYNRRPASPHSPTIVSPSFFRQDRASKSESASFKSNLTPIMELAEDFDEAMSTGDFDQADRHLYRRQIRQKCRQLTS